MEEKGVEKSYEMDYPKWALKNSSFLGVRVTGSTYCKNVTCLLEILKGKVCTQLQKKKLPVPLYMLINVKNWEDISRIPLYLYVFKAQFLCSYICS